MIRGEQRLTIGGGQTGAMTVDGIQEAMEMTTRQVQGVLRRLAPDEQEVLRLRFGLGTQRRSGEEISMLLGRPSGQVMRTELRALRRLRAASVSDAVAVRRLGPPYNLRVVRGGVPAGARKSIRAGRFFSTKL